MEEGVLNREITSHSRLNFIYSGKNIMSNHSLSSLALPKMEVVLSLSASLDCVCRLSQLIFISSTTVTRFMYMRQHVEELHPAQK